MRRHHGQDDVVLMLLEFQDELNAFEFVADTEVNGGGGAQEIHGFGTSTGPGFNVLEVKASFFLLQKYSHFRVLHRNDCPYPSEPSDVSLELAKPVRMDERI